MPRRADVSLLYDLFVVSQRVRRVLAAGMAGSGMRADEYAVYSLLFMYGPMTATEMARQLGLPFTTVLDYLKSIDAAGHLDRGRHPDDGRAVQLALNPKGVAAQVRANKHWEVVRKQVEGALRMPKAQVRAALQALDDAAAATLNRDARAGDGFGYRAKLERQTDRQPQHSADPGRGGQARAGGARRPDRHLRPAARPGRADGDSPPLERRRAR